MSQVELRFYEELNDFLPDARRKVAFTLPLNRRASVKDVIESCGVPHTEVELIIVNGRSVGFDYLVQPDDRISVYPMFESLDVTPLVRLRERPLRQTRFIVDANLGRLARYLRLLGFDTLYRNDYTDQDLAAIAAQEHRILLTRDRALLRHKIITHGYFVRADQPHTQVHEVLARLDLHRAIEPYTRCVRCNGAIHDIDKASIDHLLQPKTRRYYERFRRCQHCGQAYWHGSHMTRMQKLVEHFRQPQCTD